MEEKEKEKKKKSEKKKEKKAAAEEEPDKTAEEIEQLKRDIVRLGAGNVAGKYEIEFGTLFEDPEVQNYYDEVVETLKEAKKQKVVEYEAPKEKNIPKDTLVKDMHDTVTITLLIPPPGTKRPTLPPNV